MHCSLLPDYGPNVISCPKLLPPFLASWTVRALKLQAIINPSPTSYVCQSNENSSDSQTPWHKHCPNANDEWRIVPVLLPFAFKTGFTLLTWDLLPKPRDPPASAPQVPELKVCATFLFLNHEVTYSNCLLINGRAVADI